MLQLRRGILAAAQARSLEGTLLGILQLKITYLNTFAAGLIQAVRAKTAGSHVALHGNFSGLVSTTNLVKVSKDSASLVVCTREKIFGWGLQDFCE